MNLGGGLNMRYYMLLCAVFMVSCGADDQESQVSTWSDSQSLVVEQWWDGSAYANESSVRGTDLYTYYKLALKNNRPTRIFKELFRSGAAKKIKIKSNKSWNTFRHNRLTGRSTIEITGSLKYVNWFGFYNEVFHAWYQHVFKKSSEYKRERLNLFSSVSLDKFKQVHRKPKVAQEEAMSENFASLASYIKPFFVSVKKKKQYFNKELLGYQIGFTVIEDSHHENNTNFKKTAKPVYISRYAYKVIFKLMTGVDPVDSVDNTLLVDTDKN